jgi:U3 small nucleolar RNA-associated protein 12
VCATPGVVQMAEDILSVRFDPKGKLLCVALLDTTIKVFFADSLKFFLSLYGHKLPALTLDVSSDGALLVRGVQRRTSCEFQR